METERKNLFPVFLVVVLGFAILAFPSTAHCQNMAKHDFDTLCAPCHGITGNGQGRDLTEVNPPDITQLSRKNGGRFPFEEVYRIVDGRDMKASHKRFGMPFWGERLQKQGQLRTPVNDAAVKQRIGAIVKFVEMLQK